MKLLSTKDKNIGLSDFIYYSKYARYNEQLKRRETWEETVTRLSDMHVKRYSFLEKEDQDELLWAMNQVYEKNVLPSMRSLQFGGIPIEAKNARMYNCAVRHVDSLRAFAEIHWLLLCGCGVGIGLYKEFLNRLSPLVGENDRTGTVITYVIEDTIEGWANSVEALLMCYFQNTPYSGKKIIFDYSKIRRKGSRLKTGGGKAPGHHGLKSTHIKIKALLDDIIENQKVSRMRAIHAYDILMHCADSVLSGGIRRSACSVMFDPDDEEMITAKTYFTVDKYKHLVFDDENNSWHVKCLIKNKWYNVNIKIEKWDSSKDENYDYLKLIKDNKISWRYIEPQRARSNNSVRLVRNETSYEDFIRIAKFTKEFGEPGFVWVNHRWTLLNPCFEIGFIPVTLDGRCGVQFCNLTSQNGKKIKTKEDFRRSVKAATILGTAQAGYTKFDFLGPVAQQLTEEEALLGVSMTGMMENPHILLDPELQKEMALYAVELNKEWAKKLRINPAARITCIKPEGTGSLFLETCSGIHPHHDRQYFRRVVCNRIENPYLCFKRSNPHASEPYEWNTEDVDDVITFPQESLPNAMIKSDLSALKHLEIIKSTQVNWVLNGTTESNKKDVSHNVSCTISVKDDEWLDVYKYIYENRSYFTAVSLLPDMGDAIYKQAPFQAVRSKEDKEFWNNLVENWKDIDYLSVPEDEDGTKLSQEAACGGGGCLV